jgi:hypothetical protein
MRKVLCALLPCFCLLASLPGWSGEIVADTFVGKRNGAIRIPLMAGRWQVTDTEQGGPTSIAALKLATAIGGAHPVCDVTSAPGMAATATHEEIAEVIAKGMRDAGMDLGPMEKRTYGGRTAIRFNTVLNRSSGAAKGDAYILRGEKDYFFIICSAPHAAYEAARGAFDELVDGVRY